MFKKFYIIALSIVLALSSISFVGHNSYAYTQADIDKCMTQTVSKMYNLVSEPIVGSIGGEWTVLSLARSGIKIPKKYYENYYSTVKKTLKDCNGVLHRIKYTEYSRVILALTAINKDVTNVAGYDLTYYLADFNSVKKQGVNGPIFALIALDSNKYEIPKRDDVEVQTTREILVDYILEKEINKDNKNAGGWALSGTNPDPDVTFMALQALANYRDRADVKEAIDRALEVMSKAQLKTGGYSSWGTENSESTAQAIVALTALGIDVDSDSRFIKKDSKGNKNTVIDGLLNFYCEGGGFAHVVSGYDGGSGSGVGFNLMATDQSLYALDAYKRFKNGQNSLYDMTDAKKTLAIGENKDLEEKKDDDKDDKDDNNDNKDDKEDKDDDKDDDKDNDKDDKEDNDNKNSDVDKKNNNTKKENSSKKSSKTTKKATKKTYKTKVITKKVAATMHIKTVYTGEKDGLIPEDKKCVIVEFKNKEKPQMAVFKLDKENKINLYYSKELSQKSKVPTYIGLFNTATDKKDILKVDNYEFSEVDEENKSKSEIIFGDVNSDGIINAQDVLNIQSILSGKLDLTDDKQILAINVSMDSKIDNGDIDQIVANFISNADYTITKLWDKEN